MICMPKWNGPIKALLALALLAGPLCAQTGLAGYPASSLAGFTTIVSSGSIAVTANNTYVICTSTCTVTPLAPSASPVTQLCVRNAPGSATVITMAALGSGNYYELTTHASWGTANHTVASGGVATDAICLAGYDANHYAVMSYSGTWTD